MDSIKIKCLKYLIRCTNTDESTNSFELNASPPKSGVSRENNNNNDIK